MKINPSLKLFIYFSVFLHLFGGALYYYYKNPDLSFFTKKEEASVSENIVPSLKDSTAKEIFVNPPESKEVEQSLQETPKKAPSPPPIETEIEPIETENPSTDLLTEKNSSEKFDSDISKTKEKQGQKKSKNVKISFGSDTSKSATKNSTPIPTVSTVSDEANPTDHKTAPSPLKEIPSSDTEKVNITALPKEVLSSETQEKTDPLLEETDPLENEKTDTSTSPEDAAILTQKEESDLNLKNIPLDNEISDPSIEELTTSNTPTESLEKEVSPQNTKQMNRSEEDKSLNPNKEAVTLLEKPNPTNSSEETALLETQKKEVIPELEANPSNDEELAIPDTSKESLQKKAATEKPSFSFQTFLNLKQQPGNPRLTYPQKARQIKAQGSLSLIFYVTSEGLVEKIQIESSSGHRELDNSVVQTFARYKFLPNQEGWIRHKVDFKLKGEKVEFLRLREK